MKGEGRYALDGYFFSRHPLLVGYETCTLCEIIKNRIQIVTVVIFVIIFGARVYIYISYSIIKVDNSMLIQRSCFVVTVLKSTPNHIPLKYKCLGYFCVGFRHNLHVKHRSQSA